MTALEIPDGGVDKRSTDSARLNELRDLLQSVATGSGLHVALDRIARWVEHVIPDAICSILLVDERENSLRHGAAPSLPQAFTQIIDGVAIGPNNGSCGTAAYRAAPVVVADIASDPLWNRYAATALSFGLRACWSHPIVGARGRVVGTFAVYGRRPGRPGEDEVALVVDAAQLAALAIDRAQADTARLTHEREMASILAHATDQILRLDGQGRVTFANDAAIRASGRPAADILFLPLEELGLPASHVTEWRTALRVAAESRTVHRFESALSRHEGEIWYETSIAPEFDVDGALTSFVAVARDTTYRRRTEAHLRASEERLHLILNSTNQSIALLDVEGRLIDFGERATGTVGVDRSRMLGGCFWDLPIFADFPESQRTLRDAITRAAAGEASEGEIHWRNREGNIRLGSYSLKPIPGPDGDIAQLLLEGSDITDQRELERRLRQSEKMESLGRLAGGIAHDFNNVLAAIHGYGELLSADLPPRTEMAENVQNLLSASRRARDLVRQILAFSRKSDVKHLSIDLRAVVEDAGRLLRAGLPATVELVERTPPGPVHVLGDASQISQVLLNLGSNAEYAMRASGHGRLEISLEDVNLDPTRAHSLGMPPGPHARLAVRDTGAGIPAAVASKIFEPFFTTKPVGEGTGMGLAVVHGIVTAHGGTVHVHSAPNEGTTFELFLPTVALREPEPERPIATSVRGAGHLLVVDDEAAIVSMLARLLPRRGYSATCVTSAAEALECFRDNPDSFDCVITDRTMPRMTGDALIVALHAIRPTLPVVMCSGQGHDGALAAGAEANAIVQHVSKPFEVADLLRAVERARAHARGATTAR